MVQRQVGRIASCRFWFALTILLVLSLAACGGRASPTVTPTPLTAATPLPASPVASASTPEATEAATPAATTPASSPGAAPTPAGSPPLPTPTPTAAPGLVSQPALPPLDLRLLSPVDGSGVEIGAVRVFGLTRPDAAVAVTGVPVEVAADGSFQHDLTLERGANSVEVVTSDVSGATTSRLAVVFFVSPAAGLPLSIFYPVDGLEASQPVIPLIGGTRQDAVVGVNGAPVDINALGIFSTQITLEEGANLIEVVAVDINENVNFQTLVVFYEP